MFPDPTTAAVGRALTDPMIPASSVAAHPTVPQSGISDRSGRPGPVTRPPR